MFSFDLPYSLTWPAKKIFCFDFLNFVKKYGQVRFFHLFEFFLKFRLLFKKLVKTKTAIFVLKFPFIKSELWKENHATFSCSQSELHRPSLYKFTRSKKNFCWKISIKYQVIHFAGSSLTMQTLPLSLLFRTSKFRLQTLT